MWRSRRSQSSGADPSTRAGAWNVTAASAILGDVAQQRSTFAKLQRERDKKEKATNKAQRRAQQSTAVPEAAPATHDPEHEANVLAGLAALHAAYEEGTVSMDEFEDRRDQLRKQLQIG